MPYEHLLKEAFQHDVEVYERKMSVNIKGLYADNVICINKLISTTSEKACVLAEELGHHHTSSGDILDLTKLMNKKQEKRARNWAYKRLVPLSKFIGAYKSGVRNRYELADYLGVTELFIEETLERYKEEYGLYKTIEEYTIYFDPLAVLKNLDV